MLKFILGKRKFYKFKTRRTKEKFERLREENERLMNAMENEVLEIASETDKIIKLRKTLKQLQDS